ncbi:unnamed protein product [Linum trigynum]|uniref:Chitin-binding type-1 domain-containing protein n=1 Tax=Linum trigynum TaxID=586398 RepID=A0AAV2GUS1_9ROSI
MKQQQLVIIYGLVAIVLVAIDARSSAPVANNAREHHQRHKLLPAGSTTNSTDSNAAAATVPSSGSTNRSVGKYSSARDVGRNSPAFRSSAHKEEEEEAPADDTEPTNPEQLKCGSWGNIEKCVYASFPCCSEQWFCGSGDYYCGSRYCRPYYSIYCDA